jgi:hypothetical protein
VAKVDVPVDPGAGTPMAHGRYLRHRMRMEVEKDAIPTNNHTRRVHSFQSKFLQKGLTT